MTDALANALRVAVSQTDRNPTDAQKEAGNYAKGKVRWSGLEIAIENPKGGERSGVDKNGRRWAVRMPAHYGYVKGTEGYDGDHVDVYLGPETASQRVYVIDQIDVGSGKFDEHKCLLCYGSKADALADYQKAFSDGNAKDRIGAVTTMTVDDFKDWLRSGNTKKPLGDIRKGYATGGAVAMPSSMKRMPDGSVTFSRESLTLSPADRALQGYADGGVPDWRSDMDAPAPDYDQRTGRAGPRKPDILREPGRGEDPTAPLGERILERVLDYGPIPAKAAVETAIAPGIALGEAIDDPSLANLTNAGVQGALAFSPFAPLKAGKAALGAAGLGFGMAGARDLGPSLLGEAQAEGDGLNAAQSKRLQQLQRKRSLSRAEREEQNALIGIQARYQELRDRQTFEAQARRDAALVKAEEERKALEREAGARKAEDERREYNASVSRAEKARSEELGRYTPFKETEVGKVYDKLGIMAPAVAAAGAGLIGRTAARLGGNSGLMTDTVVPALTGAGTAGVMAHYPLMHDLVFAPAENPEKRAYQAYARELPVGHPRKEEMRTYAEGLPTENPTREVASREMYDPLKFAERTGIGIAEGLISGPLGAHVSKIAEKVPGVAARGIGSVATNLARAPGELAETYYDAMGSAAKARAKALKAGQSRDRLLGSDAELRRIEPEFRRAEGSLDEGIAEARRRLDAPGVASGLSEGAVPPGPSRSSSASSSPALEPPAKSTSKRSTKAVKDQETPKERRAAPDPKAIKAELSRGLSRGPGEPKSLWGKPPPNVDELLDAEVILQTKDKLGRKQFRTPEGRYRGGPVGKPSALSRALDVARKFANGGAVTVGPVVGHTGGREDAKPVDVAAGSFVVPADIVSSLGTGNSLAGMEHLKAVFGEPMTRASGGAVPILISDGEYVISPEQVEKIGGGDMEKGHAILDSMVLKLRKQHIDTLKSLPGPAKG